MWQHAKFRYNTDVITSAKFSNSSLLIPKYSAVQPKTRGGEPGGKGRGSGGEVGIGVFGAGYPGGLPGGVRGDGDLGSFLGVPGTWFDEDEKYWPDRVWSFLVMVMRGLILVWDSEVRSFFSWILSIGFLSVWFW